MLGGWQIAIHLRVGVSGGYIGRLWGRREGVPSLTSSSEARAMVAGSLKATLASLYVTFRLGYFWRSLSKSAFGSGTPHTTRRCPSTGVVSPPMVDVGELMG